MFDLALFCFILACILVGILVAYIYRTQPAVQYQSCTMNGDCPFDQTCVEGQCRARTCTGSSDTSCTGGICLDGYCAFDLCLYSNQCPNGAPACVDGLCQGINGTCTSNNDCRGLTCRNGKCVQCATSVECSLGEGCFTTTGGGGVCRYPNLAESLPNFVNYPSTANLIGNVLAPRAYLCPDASCGSSAQSCSATQACPSSCPYCVNDTCRCVAGQDREICVKDDDCLSHTCRPIGGNNYCIPPGGECLNNYQGGNLSCPKTKPYCVEGVCSTSSLGAVCSTPFSAPNLCSDPAVFGLTAITEPVGPFCVDGRCQAEPGQLNQFCTGGSGTSDPDPCQYPLTCQAGPNGKTCQVSNVLILD